MVDDIGDIAEYYNQEAAGEHERLERHQLEHDLTWRYLNRYLPASGKILEIGSATGRYTLELARRGYPVTAVDLSTVELELCRNRLVEQGLDDRVRLVTADARDLTAVEAADFDIALVMGPLYHLIVEADRKLALKNVCQRMKTGGIIFSSFISRYGILGELIRKVPAWIEGQEEVRSVLEHGRDPQHEWGHGFRGYFASVSEIAPLHEEVGFETITLTGVEPAISADDESYNRLSGIQRELWLDLLYKVGTEASILGASRHLLYIGKRRGL